MCKKKKQVSVNSTGHSLDAQATTLAVVLMWKRLLLSLYIYILYIYIYIYIYELKKAQNLFKLQIFLFFSETLSMYNKITNENTDNSAT